MTNEPPSDCPECGALAGEACFRRDIGGGSCPGRPSDSRQRVDQFETFIKSHYEWPGGP